MEAAATVEGIAAAVAAARSAHLIPPADNQRCQRPENTADSENCQSPLFCLGAGVLSQEWPVQPEFRALNQQC